MNTLEQFRNEALTRKTPIDECLPKTPAHIIGEMVKAGVTEQFVQDINPEIGGNYVVMIARLINAGYPVDPARPCLWGATHDVGNGDDLAPYEEQIGYQEYLKANRISEAEEQFAKSMEPKRVGDLVPKKPSLVERMRARLEANPNVEVF